MLQVGKIAGIRILLNPWFILLLLLFAFLGLSGKVILLFSAVLWHELAHAQMAKQLGFPVVEIELLPFGGVARLAGVRIVSSRQEIIIAAAGPAASLVLAAISYLFTLYGEGWLDIGEFYYKGNLMLALFNLLPGLPLDGGRILRGWLALSMDYGKATLVAAGVSKWLSIGLVMITIYEYLINGAINITFLVAALFLYTTSNSEMKVAGFHTLRILSQKKAELQARGIMTTVYFTVVEHVVLKDLLKQFTVEQYYVIRVVNMDSQLCGTITETEIWNKLPQKGILATVGECI